MKCYQHREEVSIGICKACQKSVCAICAKDTGKGLACSDACVTEITETQEMIEKSKQIYGIGSNAKKSFNFNIMTALMLFIIALILLGLGLSPLLKGKSIFIFPTLVSFVLIAYSVLLYIRAKKLSLKY